MNDARVTKGSHAGGTVVAMIMAPIVILAAGGLGGAAFGIIQHYLAGFDGWPLFAIVGVAQAIIGTLSARSACDAVLKSYNRRAVFVEIAVICAVLFVVSAYLLPLTIRHGLALAELALIIFMSFGLFWKVDGVSP